MKAYSQLGCIFLTRAMARENGPFEECLDFRVGYPAGALHRHDVMNFCGKKTSSGVLWAG